MAPPPIKPCPSDRVVDAYQTARDRLEVVFPEMDGYEREQTITWQQTLHEELCVAVQTAFIDGVRAGRRTSAKPRRDAIISQ